MQENSNLTYRLYDYDRVDKEGRKRELHIEKVLDAANLRGSSESRQPVRQLVQFDIPGDSFQVFLGLDGCGVVLCGSDRSFNFFKGDCIFAPAGVVGMRMRGKVRFLNVRCWILNQDLVNICLIEMQKRAVKNVWPGRVYN